MEGLKEMPERRQRPMVTETVADLDGQKVLVVKVDGAVRGVQDAAAVAERIEKVGTLLDTFDSELARSDSEHLAAAQKRVDDQIEGLRGQKAALNAESVVATAKARLQERRSVLAAQKRRLEELAAQMAAG